MDFRLTFVKSPVPSLAYNLSLRLTPPHKYARMNYLVGFNALADLQHENIIVIYLCLHVILLSNQCKNRLEMLISIKA